MKRASNYEYQRVKRPRRSGCANGVQTTFDHQEQGGEPTVTASDTNRNNAYDQGLEAERPARGLSRCQNNGIESVSEFKDEESYVNNISLFEFLAILEFSGDSGFFPIDLNCDL
jgi:hypothetical protein